MSGLPIPVAHDLAGDITHWTLPIRFALNSNSNNHFFESLLFDSTISLHLSCCAIGMISLQWRFLLTRFIAEQEYWNWSWDELVTRDLPAIFDFVYDRTGNKKINYVGHSLVSSIYFTLPTTKPDNG